MDRRKSKKWLIKAFSSSLAALVLLGACTSTEKRETAKLPDWVTQPPSDARYLYGVGSAALTEDPSADFSAAQKQADADIASQLRQTVSNRNLQLTQVEKLNNQEEKVTQSLSSQTKVETAPIVLEQAENVDRYQAEHYVYALQRLDRQRVVTRLRRQIDDLDMQLLDLAKQAQTDVALEQQWQSLMPAVTLLSQRQQYLELLQLYSQRDEAMALPEQVIRLKNQLNQLLQRLTIAVVEQGGETRLPAQVSAALTEKGLTPATAGNGLLVLTLNSSYESRQQADRQYSFLNTSASLTGANGHKYAQWTLSARGISATTELARADAEHKLAQNLSDQLFLWFTAAH